MSLIFFLSVKEKHTHISSCLSQIISTYEELQFLTDNMEETNENYNKFEDLKMYKTLLNDYNSKLEVINIISNIVNDVINDLCEHNYIYDTIDIDLDRSKTICYCSICGIPK